MSGRIDEVRRWLFSVALLVTAVSAPASAQEAPPTCESADALRDGGDFDGALGQYSEILRRVPESVCARAGVKTLAVRWRAAAAALEEAGAHEQAVEALVKGLRADPAGLPNEWVRVVSDKRLGTVAQGLVENGFVDEAVKLLTTALAAGRNITVPDSLRPSERQHRQFELARRLRDLGLDDEALKVMRDAVSVDPTTPIPDDLDSLDDSGRSDGWSDLRQAVVPTARSVAEIVGAALIALFIVGAVLSAVWRNRRTQLRVGTFDSGPDETGGRHGSAFAVRVRESLSTLANEPGRSRIDVVGQWADGVVIPTAVTDAVPQATLARALIEVAQQFFPKFGAEIDGFFHLSATGGPGVTVRCISRRGRVRGERTFWADDYHLDAAGPAWEWEPLVIPVTIWSMWAFSQRRWSWLQVRPRRFTRTGTSDVRSYTEFAMGARAQGAG